MKVILTKNVPSLGKVGQVVEVKDGYALNYLIPNGLAQDATPKTMASLKSQKEQEKRQQIKVQDSNAKLKRVIVNQSVKILAKSNDSGKLFAAVGTQDIIGAIKNKFNLSIEPKYIHVPQPIKTLGSHEVLLKVDNEEVKFWLVVKKL